MPSLSEPFVRKSIVRWLTSKNQKSPWEIRSTAEMGEHGVDIFAERNGIYFIIEAKGDADPRTVKKAGPNREVKFQQAVAQIVSRMTRQRAAQYAIGLPYTYRDLAVRRIPWTVSRKLNLRILLVSEDGKVSAFNSRDLKVLQGRKRL